MIWMGENTVDDWRKRSSLIGPVGNPQAEDSQTKDRQAWQQAESRAKAEQQICPSPSPRKGIRQSKTVEKQKVPARRVILRPTNRVRVPLLQAAKGEVLRGDRRVCTRYYSSVTPCSTIPDLAGGDTKRVPG